MTIEEEIKNTEDEIRKTPYNKATSHHIGRLKAKLARLRDELQKRATAATAASKSESRGYAVKKSGDATVVLVGFPSVGKSTLLNRLTGTSAEVAAYDFTTLEVIPGTLLYKGARIQFLDLPGLVRGAATGRGRGREVISVLRNADLILFVLDPFQPQQQYETLAKELHDAGVRINAKPPAVRIRRTSRGGIAVNSTVPLALNPDDTETADSETGGIDEETIRAVLSEYKILNAEVLIRERVSLDRLIDAVLGNRSYIPALTAVNKVDLASSEFGGFGFEFKDAIPISAALGTNIEALKARIYDKLGFIRTFMKPQGAPPDLENPLVVRRNSTVADVCSAIHRDFVARFRYARVWGKSVKFGGQRVGLSHLLADGDVVSIAMQRR